jgi:signal transduction histidine kinase
MNPLRPWFEPLNLAAYITWLAVLLSMEPKSGFFAAGSSAAVPILMGVFLGAFLLRQAVPSPRALIRSCGLISVQTVVALILCATEPNATAPVLAVLIMAQLAMLLQPYALVLFGIALNICLGFIFIFYWKVQKPWIYLLIYVGFQAFATLTAWYARRAQENSTTLQQVNAQLLATRSLLEESARDQERLRLARELHDVAGHKLTALKLNLALLQRRQDGGGATLALSAQLADELLGDIRGVVSQMRQHDGMDLRQALEQLAAPLPRPRVRLELAEDARADSVAIAEVIVRAAQEALTNIARHGDASEAVIGLTREDGQLVLRVRDNGRRVADLREGNGLRGMRERVQTLGGTMRLERLSRGGVELSLHLPLAPSASASALLQNP